MAINPDNITTIRVDQLAPATLDLTKLVPIAEVNGELKQSTIQDLADLIATTISASGGVGFLPLVVTNGQQLPDVPENPSFFLCGAGTYLNINGYPDVICTEALNAVVSLTDHWQLAVEIPIVAEVGVQTVTGSAVDNTDPLNPVINEIIDGVQTIVAGTNITVDNTDPSNPIISASGGGGGGSVDSVTGTLVDNTDPANPVIDIPTLQEVMEVGRDYGEFVGDYLYNLGFSSGQFAAGIVDETSGSSAMILKGNEIYFTLSNGGVGQTIDETSDYTNGKKINTQNSFGTNQLRIPFKTSGTGLANFEVQNNLPAGTYRLATLDDIPSTSTLVPYTGATQDVNLGAFDLYANKVWLYDEPNDNYGSIHFTDSDFHIEDADGHKMFVIEDGFVQLHKTDTIQSNLYTSGLSATRDHYLPNESGTIALTSNIPTIDSTPTDGSSNAVSSNGVFDALDLKQNTLGYTPVRIVTKESTLSSGVTGTTAETILRSTQILGGTFSANDIMQLVSARFQKTGTAGTVTYRIYINTSNSLSGATQIAQLSGANIYAKIGTRTFTLRSGNILGVQFTSNGSVSGGDIGSTSAAIGSAILNPANNFWLIRTAQLVSASDTAFESEFYITN